MSDLISRQEAIDAIKRIDSHGNSDRANGLGLAENAIILLPSAETNCVKCKHYYETEEEHGIESHCRMDSAHATEDRLAVALMGYMLEYVPWYHLKDGELISGATSDMEALYKASDIREMIEKIGGLQE